MQKRKMLLVVEDSPLERALLRKFLGNEYELLETENGKEALRALSGKDKPDLILSDFIMPEMNGKQLLEELGQNEELKDIPVLIATGADDIEIELECLHLGCWDFIHKPYNPRLLRFRIENTLDRKAYYKLRQKMIVDTFEKHVDPSIVEHLLRKEADFGAAREKELTVLFSDVRNFTTFSERLSPTEVFDFLTECFTITNECIIKYGGVLDKYIGDASMVFWGAPEDCEDGAYLACRTALEMIQNTRELFEHYSEVSGVPVALGIGINKGRAIVGNVGPVNRVEYTAIGDTVNIASRLEGAAPGGQVYIGESVLKSAENRIGAVPLSDPLKLKGKERTISVYRLERIVK